jgi:hypothetical protein
VNLVYSKAAFCKNLFDLYNLQNEKNYSKLVSKKLNKNSTMNEIKFKK